MRVYRKRRSIGGRGRGSGARTDPPRLLALRLAVARAPRPIRMRRQQGLADVLESERARSLFNGSPFSAQLLAGSRKHQ